MPLRSSSAPDAGCSAGGGCPVHGGGAGVTGAWGRALTSPAPWPGPALPKHFWSERAAGPLAGPRSVRRPSGVPWLLLGVGVPRSAVALLRSPPVPLSGLSQNVRRGGQPVRGFPRNRCEQFLGTAVSCPCPGDVVFLSGVTDAHIVSTLFQGTHMRTVTCLSLFGWPLPSWSQGAACAGRADPDGLCSPEEDGGQVLGQGLGHSTMPLLSARSRHHALFVAFNELTLRYLYGLFINRSRSLYGFCDAVSDVI